MGKFGDWMSNNAGGIIGSLISTIGAGIISKKTNEANAKQQEEANKTNIKLQEMANAAQAQESEKAYDRSKATNQVALLQQAGMSKAGAINSLNQGGSYTPAAVNAAQVDASSTDNSGVIAAMQEFANVGQQIDARKQEYKIFQEQKVLAERELAMKEKESQARINAHAAETAGKEYENRLKALTVRSQEAWSKAISMYDAQEERFDTASDFRFWLQRADKKLYDDVMSDPAALSVIDAFMNNQNKQRTENVEANVAEMTENEKVELVRNALQISKNEVKLSGKEVQKATKELERLGLLNDIASIQRNIAVATESSTIKSTNATNEHAAAYAGLNTMRRYEKRIFDRQELLLSPPS